MALTILAWSAPALGKQAAVGHFMRQRVLERVFDLRKQLGFIDELGGLELRQPFAEGVARHIGDGFEQRQGQVLADYGGGLQQPLVLGGEAIDARG
jgi:hypothetical protein